MEQASGNRQPPTRHTLGRGSEGHHGGYAAAVWHTAGIWQPCHRKHNLSVWRRTCASLPFVQHLYLSSMNETKFSLVQPKNVMIRWADA
jgi:hypothetical protein